MSERERHLEEEVQRLREENRLLREKVDLLVRKVFGPSSEKLDANQLMLLEAEQRKKEEACAVERPDAQADEPGSERHRVKKTPRLPEDLPVEERFLDPEEVTKSPQRWRCIGSEVSEQLDYRPGRFCRVRLVRRKYALIGEPYRAPVIAPLPPSLQERCLATPELIAQVVISKYGDHLPLYRQEQIYKQRHGVWLPRQTLARWVELAAFWLEPIYRHMQQHMMQGGYLQIDETPIRYLQPGAGKAPQGYLWSCAHPQGDVLYTWKPSRAASCLDNIIPVDFRGILQCDGYQAYRSFQKNRDGPVELAGCWAHVRRKFWQARERSPITIGWILRQIGHLYKIESHLRDAKAGPARRLDMRTSHSRMIYRRLHRVLVRLKTSRRYLPQSAIGRAIDYTLNLWPMLGLFLEHGRVEIDNNLIENAIRPTAIGKKNWLFIGDKEAGQRSAILFSLIQSCRRHNIDPHAYLRDVLQRLPQATTSGIPGLTPRAWAQEQRQQSPSRLAAA